MTGLIVGLSLFCLLSILLLLSFKITLKIDNKADLKVSYFGITVYQLGKEVKKPSGKKKALKPKSEKDGLLGLLQKYSKETDKGLILKEIIDFLNFLFSRFKAFLSHVRFKNLVFDLTVATDDAAKTAILYGTVCSAVYSLVTLLNNASHFDPKKISISTDFTSDKMKIYINSVIKIRLCFVLAFAFSILFKIIKTKLGEINNGRK